MDNTSKPPIPPMYSSKVMYDITTPQYLRVVGKVVEDLGEPSRKFRAIFERAHEFFKRHQNPSVYTLELENVYSTRSMSSTMSLLRKIDIIDEDGFFTSIFHTAYYWKYQHIYEVRNILIER